MDFCTDLTLNIEYTDPEKFYKDFPTRGQCKELDYQVSACLFYQMDQWTLFAISMSVFVLTYLCDFAFVMNSELTRHYRAVLVGRCCWKNCLDRHVNKYRRWFVWFCLFWLNQQVGDNGLKIASTYANCILFFCHTNSTGEYRAGKMRLFSLLYFSTSFRNSKTVM